MLPEQDASHLNVESHELRIHSIESFGTHDGPGIRLVIFAQGCQFRCLYCQNPDTIDVKGGKFIELKEIIRRAKNMKSYFRGIGGVTISGGEPLLQRSRILELFKLLHEEGINTCLDTNGRVLDQHTKELLEETDTVMLDVKHFDNEWHKKLTGASNLTTLKLAEYREETGKTLWLRYVLVPGWSDQPEHIEALGQHFKDYKSIEKIELIPYHKLGVNKWEVMGWKYELEGVEPPTEAETQQAADILRKYFKEVKVK
ncbi:pyruvate formate-lyase-activating protein [Persicobacter psychrovividus]|uniref:Pyruvate formate-lyase-activating enzyme n=1 Tax=Persicobacter psychrovividus TaxID=387638 RepID=A0ABN6L697_9BACT|nr:pyruvate formate-lyase-activating enzyme [Persicobacter psychrovividus]